jgi:hypothetical protein
MVVSKAMWIAFAKLVVPPVIDSADRGESPPLVNGSQGPRVNPVVTTKVPRI